MLTRRQPDTPVNIPDSLFAAPPQDWSERVAQLERQLQTMVQEHLRLVTALQTSWDVLNQAGALEIVAGRINASPIGDAEASTGAFTTLAVSTSSTFPKGSLSVTLVPSAGAITSYTINEQTYTLYGNRVFFSIRATMTNNGTGSGILIVAGGVTFVPSEESAASAKNITTGKAMGGRIFSNGGTLNVQLHLYDGTYPVTTGDVFVVSGQFRIA